MIAVGRTDVLPRARFAIDRPRSSRTEAAWKVARERATDRSEQPPQATPEPQTLVLSRLGDSRVDRRRPRPSPQSDWDPDSGAIPAAAQCEQGPIAALFPVPN